MWIEINKTFVWHPVQCIYCFCRLQCSVYLITTIVATLFWGESQEKKLCHECISLCVRVWDSQHSMGLDVVCRDTVLPLGWLMCTRNTNRTRVFLRPMSVSPLRSSMSELRSFKIPAQSILGQRHERAKNLTPRFKDHTQDCGEGGRVHVFVFLTLYDIATGIWKASLLSLLLKNGYKSYPQQNLFSIERYGRWPETGSFDYSTAWKTLSRVAVH